jgi:predicted DNA-binding transcriptional regulator YafY
MSRNDQVIRQWFLLRKLEDSRGLAIDELARALPEDYACHPRTVRRDLQALEVVFPLVTELLDGKTRWRLMDGFRSLPAPAFSPTELMALILSRDLLKPLDGTHIKGSLDSAFSKVLAAMPPEGMALVRQMQGYFSVGLGPHKTYGEQRNLIEQVSRAITHKRTVQMRYYSASRDATSRREVDPYRLWYAAGALYLVGYCHLRKSVRMFAVERIRSLAITNHPYQMPLGFDLEAYVRDALVVMRGEPVEVELLFDRATAAWVRDRQWHPSQRLEQGKRGELRMFLRVADTRELLGWILSFGACVRILRPESLREKVRAEAKRILDQT